MEVRWVNQLFDFTEATTQLWEKHETTVCLANLMKPEIQFRSNSKSTHPFDQFPDLSYSSKVFADIVKD